MKPRTLRVRHLCRQCKTLNPWLWTIGGSTGWLYKRVTLWESANIRPKNKLGLSHTAPPKAARLFTRANLSLRLGRKSVGLQNFQNETSRVLCYTTTQ
jgi:hypothetical protein